MKAFALLIAFIPALIYGQVITKKPVVLVKIRNNAELDKIISDVDTYYTIQFRNEKYTSIVDIGAYIFNPSELKEFSKGLTAAKAAADDEQVSIIGMIIHKRKSNYVLWKDDKMLTINEKKLDELVDAIAKE